MTPDEEQAFERLKAENAELREQLAVALAQIVALEAQLHQRGDPPAFVKPNQPKAPRSGLRKKRAAEHNTSRKRLVATRIERHALERCPECAYRLSGESLDYSREVVELPPPQPVAVIEHQVVKRWCPHCARWRSPQLDLTGQVFGQGRIGVRIAGVVAYLRTMLRLPVRLVQSYLQTLHGLHLSIGEIAALVHSVRQHLQPLTAQLKQAVQASPVVHGDETGWRENGQNGWAWAFVTAGPAAVRYYEYDPGRSHFVPQRVLGSDWRGCLVTDFYAAYNLIPGRHQRCWVHLLRDLHALKEAHAESAEVLAWAAAVRQLYDDAQTWLNAHPMPGATARTQQYLSLHARTCGLGQQYARAPSHPCATLAKRLLRHQDELFQFVLTPGLPADNNLAERSIRPLVVLRNISGGSRSAAGTATRFGLASLFGTWQARHLNPLTECLRALQPPPVACPPAPP